MPVMNWKNKLINLKFSIIIVLIIFTSCSKSVAPEKYVEEKPTIYVTNWLQLPKNMDIINKEFMKKHPDIDVKYIEYKNTAYDNQMLYQLKAGIAPDIIYLRSYDAGMKIYDTGYLQELNDIIPELKDFAKAPIQAWSSKSGKSYAVPSLGVVHGIYYNKKIFKKYNLSKPNTWEDFISVCRILKSAGENVFALGTNDNWLLYEVLFSGLGPNFYGGEETRQKLLNKTIKINSQPFIKTFNKLQELITFLPQNYKSIGYGEMREMFAKGKSAMYIGGSWDISNLKANSDNPEVFGFFAPPLEKKNDKLQYCFHVDVGVAMNRVSRYPEAAKKYIQWVASQEYAKLSMDQFPGFFSYTPGNYSLQDNLAKEMESYISKSIPTVRTLWEKLSAESPTGNDLLGEAVKGVLNKEISASDAADYVDSGLSWYYK